MFFWCQQHKLWISLGLIIFKYFQDFAGNVFINHGSISIENFSGDTPLHLAAGNGKCNCAEALLQGGADPNLVNDEGMHLLSYFLKLHQSLIINFKNNISLKHSTWINKGYWQRETNISREMKRNINHAFPSFLKDVQEHNFRKLPSSSSSNLWK